MYDQSDRSHRNSGIRALISGALVLLFLITAHPALSQRLLEYSGEVPSIDYSQDPDDSVTRLFSAIARGEISPAWNSERGYLDYLLEYFGISPGSQVLVFSKTALKGRLISPDTPRAIYFNDNVYIAIVPGTPALEIASMDSLLGPVFYEVPLRQDEDITLRRHTSRCLNCHAQNYLRDGGVPKMLFKSALTAPDGEVFRGGLAQRHTTMSTPLPERWGGWYVTGESGTLQHRGNLTFDTMPDEQTLASSNQGSFSELDALFDTSPYIAPSSDIVALLVMQHQVDVQNEIARVNYQVRSIMEREGDITSDELAEKTEPLLQALFMANEAPLSDTVRGTSGFTEYFQNLGPFDSNGHSLRELDLQNRVFRYPLSYQIYTEAFDALPAPALTYLRQRVSAVLNGSDQTENFSHLSATDRSIILDLLRETKPGLLEDD